MSERAAHTPGPWTVRVGQKDSGPFDRTTIEAGPEHSSEVIATVNMKILGSAANADLLAVAPDLKAFADAILIYTIEGDAGNRIWLRFGSLPAVAFKINSPAGAALLRIEAARKAAIAKAGAT